MLCVIAWRRTSVARSNPNYEENKEPEALITTAVLIKDASIVLTTVENEPNEMSAPVINRLNVLSWMDRKTPTEAAAVEKGTIQGLFQNRKLQLLLLIVVGVTVSISVTVVLSIVPFPPAGLLRLNKNASIETHFSQYTWCCAR